MGVRKKCKSYNATRQKCHSAWGTVCGTVWGALGCPGCHFLFKSAVLHNKTCLMHYENHWFYNAKQSPLFSMKDKLTGTRIQFCDTRLVVPFESFQVSSAASRDSPRHSSVCQDDSNYTKLLRTNAKFKSRQLFFIFQRHPVGVVGLDSDGMKWGSIVIEKWLGSGGRRKPKERLKHQCRISNLPMGVVGGGNKIRATECQQ